jgi:hypothetical protein
MDGLPSPGSPSCLAASPFPSASRSVSARNNSWRSPVIVFGGGSSGPRSAQGPARRSGGQPALSMIRQEERVIGRFTIFCRWLISLTLVLPWTVLAEHVAVDVKAVRTAHPPLIDGALTDSVWQLGVPESRFAQLNPVEFGEPSQRTEVAVLYDDQALYIGIRLLDSAPDSIIARLVRRDVDAESDYCVVFLDPFHDHRSGYYFGINAAGSLYDGVRYNDTWSDDSWDGVWEGAVSRDSLGWSVEFKLPFSQMRFQRQADQTWGINFGRLIARHHEDVYTAVVSKTESAFVSRFGHLTGLENLPMPRYVEVLPYVRGRARYRPHENGDPFNTGREYVPAAGADLKMGVGPDLTLNATINPDFGQVEVDPAVVNLSDVETYFTEKRPFFVEGAKTFEFGYGGVTSFWSSNWPAPEFFYSRRIGRTPQGSPHYPEGSDADTVIVYESVPEGAHILGAAKLTGRLAPGLTFGSLHAVTMRERAELSYRDQRSLSDVEPATYYMVTRAQKEIAAGFRGFGGLITATHRSFAEEHLKSEINSDAYTGGLDGWTFLDRNRAYAISGWLGLSHIRGTPERMIEVQRSSGHYFQRPDARHVSVDSAATSLTGWAARLLLNKEKGNWRLNSAVGIISPGFDSNDLGYLSRTDVINTHVGGGYRWATPTSWTQDATLTNITWSNWDFDGNNTHLGSWAGLYLQFLNYWTMNLSGCGVGRTVNTTRTRGGPLTINRPGWELNADVTTDSRKPWVLSAGTSGYTAARDYFDRTIWMDAEWKAAGNLSLIVGPQLTWSNYWLRWVGAFEDSLAVATYGTRYVFSAIRQTELSASLRLNWTFTPKLSLQVYAQPLISSADYFDFRELSRPKSFDFHTYPASDVSYDSAEDTYTIDPDGGGPAQSFSFSQPDFDYRSLRGNVVLRWEYRPGSIAYLVWTHGREDSEMRGRFDLGRALDRLFDAPSDDILLVKVTYWLNW